ncbi:MAG: class I SAM-dependent methyltransferase [Chitinophagales bacterium]
MTTVEQKASWETKDWHELTEEDILAANIKKYEDDHIVGMYDTDSQESSAEYLEHELFFPIITQLLKKKSQSIKAIDICGGGGKASFILHHCGCDVVLLDSAEKMLDIARNKIQRDGINNMSLVNSDAIAYLRDSTELFDIAVFSSAIHHFKDPFGLIKLAFDRLSPNGIMVILGEPTPLVSSNRWRRALAFWTFLYDKNYRRKQIVSIPSRIRGTYIPGPDERDPAEYQAYLGIEDRKLKQQMINAGMQVMLHIHYPAGGPPFITRMMPLLGLNWVMGMVIGRENDNQLRHRLKEAVQKELPYKVDFIP